MRRLLLMIVMFVPFAAATGAWGQVAKLQTSVKHRPTFVDADFAQIAAKLTDLTSRSFQIEPGVCALVTASWDKPLSTEEFYQAFLQIARALGYVVAEEGLVTKISLAPDTPSDPTPPCRRYPVRVSGQQ